MHLKENLFQPPMKELNVAVIGAGFMGKAHSAAYAVMPMFFWPPPTMPIRKVIVDVTDARAEEARQRLGFQESATDRRETVNRSDIDLVRHRNTQRQPRRDCYCGCESPETYHLRKAAR